MNGNERREWTVQLWKELLNVLLIFYVHFRSFSSFWPFLNHFWPQKAFFGHFWGFLGPNLTKMNEIFFVQNGNERRERNIHFHWTEMNAENKTFIFTERKWTQRTKCSFKMNVRMKRSFKKNGCPTLPYYTVGTAQSVLYSQYCTVSTV